MPGRLVAYGEAMQEDLQALRVFLREQLYWHYQVLRMTDKARRIIRDLFRGLHGRAAPAAAPGQ